jgi:hypothetical protein
MSRRHHGNRPHRSNGQPRPTDPVRSALDAPAAADPGERTVRPAPALEPPPGSIGFVAPDRPAGPPDPSATDSPVARAAAPDRAISPGNADGAPAQVHEPDDHQPVTDQRSVDGSGPNGGPDGFVPAPIAGCTAPQLRRFIKSRPYVPMHELRRRFGINGTEDDVSSIDLGNHRVYVGLPPREGSLLGDLLRGGDIGYELSLDPRTPIVIGLYPMRPVARS